VDNRRAHKAKVQHIRLNFKPTFYHLLAKYVNQNVNSKNRLLDTERTTSKGVIKIGSADMVVEDCFKGPIVIGDPDKSQIANSFVQFVPESNDHEASSSGTLSKHIHVRWCLSSLTRTHKWKLQRLHNQEKREQDAERQRDEFFNKTKPMSSPKWEWKLKATYKLLEK
jgi:hypothetical protein